MNLIDCTVTEITGPIWSKYDRFWVPVNYIAYGQPGNSEIMCRSLEEAEAVKVGLVFQQ